MRFSELPFPVALGLLAILTVAGVALFVLTGMAPYVWVLIPIVGALAALYLYGYSQRPGPEEAAWSGPDAEPFDDPVEAADRAEMPHAPGADPAEPAGKAETP